MLIFFCILGAYLLGGVPFGIIVAKCAGYGDLRKIGSGNIGATNVMRAAGLKLAVLVWFLDMMKVMVPVFIGQMLFGQEYGLLFGIFGILGHCYPVWLQFKGGKGVSSLFGVLLMFNPILFIVCGAEWLLMVLGTGYSSLGALVVFLLIPIFGFCISIDVGFMFLFVSLLGTLKHKDNIKRLLQGTESIVKWKWKK